MRTPSSFDKLRTLPALLLFLLAACAPTEKAHDLSEMEGLLKALDYNEAKKRLAVYLPTVSPDSVEWSKASYMLMLSYWHSSPSGAESVARATKIGEELLQSTSIDQELRYRIQLDLARIDEIADFQADEIKLESARARYLDLVKTSENESVSFEAMIRLANTYRKEVSLESTHQAVRIIKDHLTDSPEVEYWTSMAWQTMGDIKGLELRDYVGALEAYENAYSRGFVNLNQNDQYLWKMAYWAEANGDTERAIELLTVIAGEMPRSTFQTLARNKIVDLGGTPPDISGIL